MKHTKTQKIELTGALAFGGSQKATITIKKLPKTWRVWWHSSIDAYTEGSIFLQDFDIEMGFGDQLSDWFDKYKKGFWCGACLYDYPAHGSAWGITEESVDELVEIVIAFHTQALAKFPAFVANYKRRHT